MYATDISLRYFNAFKAEVGCSTRVPWSTGSLFPERMGPPLASALSTQALPRRRGLPLPSHGPECVVPAAGHSPRPGLLRTACHQHLPGVAWVHVGLGGCAHQVQLTAWQQRRVSPRHSAPAVLGACQPKAGTKPERPRVRAQVCSSGRRSEPPAAGCARAPPSPPSAGNQAVPPAPSRLLCPRATPATGYGAGGRTSVGGHLDPGPRRTRRFRPSPSPPRGSLPTRISHYLANILFVVALAVSRN